MLAASTLLTAAGIAAAAPRVEYDIPYAFAGGAGASLRRQSFDLYLPAVQRPPLVVFVHGGFWAESDDEYRIGPRLAQALAADGAAVALVRYRLSPAVQHPAHANDVAAALAALKRLASRYDYDFARLYLIGHSAGATIAAQLALDPRYLQGVGLKTADLAGAVLISGIYDLGPTGPMAARHEPFARAAFGTDPAARREASPLAHARPGPPLLVLAAAADFPGFAADARRFVRRLHQAGHARLRDAIIPGRDHFSIIDFAKEKLVRALIGDFLGVKPLASQNAELLRLRQRWYEPPFSTEPFWRAGVPVRSYDVAARLRAALERIYEDATFELGAYPLRRYHAIDLLAYLDRLPPERVGRGDYLTVTNVRGERLYFSRREIAPYRPVLVIGLDDERNLFRLNVFYRNRLEYSWRPDQPPIMARPAGAFIHFLDEPPPALRPGTRGGFGLTVDSFRLAQTDPFAILADLPHDVRDILVRRNACLSCHSFRGVGARTGHIEAATGKLRGGFALPLEAYPPEPWRRFVFDQAASARLIGVRPNPIEGPGAQELYELVVAERARRRPPR